MTGPSWRARSTGQALVETALVIPLAVFLLIAVVDLGIGVYAYNTIANAARQGARIAAVNQLDYSTHDPGEGICVQDRPVQNPSDAYWSIKDCTVHFAVSLGIPATSVDVAYLSPAGTSISCDDEDDLTVGCIARVGIDYWYRPFTPLVSSIFPDGIRMSAASEMPIERVFP